MCLNSQPLATRKGWTTWWLNEALRIESYDSMRSKSRSNNKHQSNTAEQQDFLAPLLDTIPCTQILDGTWCVHACPMRTWTAAKTPFDDHLCVIVAGCERVRRLPCCISAVSLGNKQDGAHERDGGEG